MSLYKTVDNDQYLRIENTEGAAITIRKNRSYGHILSIVVPENMRDQGVGDSLIAAAEQELAYCGIRWMDAEFFESTEMPEKSEEYSESAEVLNMFLEKEGFTISPGAQVLSVPMESLLNSIAVKKMQLTRFEGMEVVPLAWLSIAQWDALINRFKKQHVNIENRDISRMDQDLSVAVYDDRGTLRAIVLCSDAGEDLNVDFLLGFGKDAQEYIMTALQGMFTEIVDHGGADRYRNLTAIAVNKSVRALMKKALGDDNSPEKMGATVYARKKIREDGQDDLSEEKINDDDTDSWRREIGKLPMQANINYKMPWIRANVKEEDRKGKADRPKLTVDFEKFEDERYGLENEGSIRITADNLEQFKGYIPQDITRDIIRPYYRGLAVLNKKVNKPEALMVWAYENLESYDDTRSRILYFRTKSKEAGDKLLSEYTTEIIQENTVESYFYLDGLSDVEKEIIKEAGFKTDNRENTDIILTDEALKAVSISKDKALRFVKPLSAINDKEFKRGIGNILLQQDECSLEDAAYLTKDWFDREMSCCTVTDDEVTGMLLTHRLTTGEFYVDMVQSVGSDPEKDILNMIRFSLGRLQEKYKSDAKVMIRINTESDKLLADRFFSGVKGEEVFFGERKEW